MYFRGKMGMEIFFTSNQQNFLFFFSYSTNSRVSYHFLEVFLLFFHRKFSKLFYYLGLFTILESLYVHKTVFSWLFYYSFSIPYAFKQGVLECGPRWCLNWSSTLNRDDVVGMGGENVFFLIRKEGVEGPGALWQM